MSWAPFHEYIFGIPRAIVCILFIFLAVKIWRLKKDYLLNQLYMVGFLGWATYILMDGIYIIIAPLNPTGYAIARILRDIQLIGVMICSFCIYNAQKIIDQGIPGWKSVRTLIEAIIYGIILGVLLVYDDVVIFDREGTLLDPTVAFQTPALVYKAGTNIDVITLLLSLFPMVVFIGAVIRQFVIIQTKIEDPGLKRRMRQLTWGLAIIPMGLLYFIIQNIVGVYSVGIVLAGFLFWVVSPVVIWKSQNHSKSQ